MTPTSPADAVLPSFEEELAAHQRNALRVGALLAAVLIVGFAALDAWLVRDAWLLLLGIRLASAMLMVVAAALVGRGALSPLPAGLLILAAVCGPIEVGVLYSGGAASVYLYSMLIPMAAISILVPFRVRQVAVLHAEVLAIALGPLALAAEQRAGRMALVVPASYLLTLAVVGLFGARLQEELRRREYKSRLEAARQVQLANLGKLAGGLAHELANPLSAVTVELELLGRHRHTPAPRSIERLKHGVERMREILTAMRQGARVADGRLQPTDLCKQVELALTLLAPQLRDVEVQRELEPLPEVPAQPTLIGQVLVNLLLNAAFAVRGSARPRIVVRTRRVDGKAAIEVEDSGPGVAPELRERIFEPLFSTKGEEGNGLGLWISAEIARFHRGSLSVRDGAQGGALFRLELPVDAEASPSSSSSA